MTHFPDLSGAGQPARPHLVKRLVSLVGSGGGAAAIEFGLAVLILLILLAGALDYGALINQTLNLEAATRGAAQYAAQNPSASGATVAAYGNFPASVTPTVATVCTCVDNSSVSCTGTCNVSGDTRVIKYLQVSATQTYSPVVPYTRLLLPANVTALASLRIQ